MRQPQVDDEQIELREVGAHAGEQLGGAFHGHGAMAGALQRRLEAVADERRIVGDEDGFGAGGASGHGRGSPIDVSEYDVESVSVRCRIYQVLVIIRNKWLPAPSVTQRSKSTSTTWTKATCSAVPSAVRISKSPALSPIELDVASDDDDDDEDDEDEERKKPKSTRTRARRRRRDRGGRGLGRVTPELRAILPDMRSVDRRVQRRRRQRVSRLGRHEVLGERALCVTAESPSYPGASPRSSRSESRASATCATKSSSPARSIAPEYRANPENRCYFCKHELYTRLTELARERGFAHVADGTNADDRGDYRPGRVAREAVRRAEPARRSRPDQSRNSRALAAGRAARVGRAGVARASRRAFRITTK